MKVTIHVEVEVNHTSGKFASKSDLAELIRTEIEDTLSLDTITTDDAADYRVDLDSVHVWETE